MKTSKIAITIPVEILYKIDSLANELHKSRSSLLSEGARLLAKKLHKTQVATTYDKVFRDSKINQEQIKVANAYLEVNNIDDY